jgi:hypothetical protein
LPSGTAKRPTWRRRLLIVTGVVSVLVVVCVAVVSWMFANATTSNVDDLTFAHELEIPPLLAPTVDADGVKHFALDVQAGTTEFRDGVHTPTWGVNGA